MMFAEDERLFEEEEEGFYGGKIEQAPNLRTRFFRIAIGVVAACACIIVAFTVVGKTSDNPNLRASAPAALDFGAVCNPPCRVDTEVCVYTGYKKETTCEPKEVPEPSPGLSFDCNTTEGALNCEKHGMLCCGDPNGEPGPLMCHKKCED
eukprot:g4763.t1